ncbi:MAG TPA: tRNA (adenosine(37)-N6)-threonylcarbamoyltransferase complex transferase subunit TsaD [Elusimicrobiales bacterium]|nr:tRNA (adenosine(37)-N6)-threonylcarbamoyltransferase complex transferase subunit TsaD [Elusimicrobiales bacterium]
MRVLAIETTCDETSVCLLDGGRILSNVVLSQIPLHRKYSGVVPELASRAHLENIPGVLSAALTRAGYRRPFFRSGRPSGPKIDAVVFSRGPGLPGALLVSRVAAETAARLLGTRLIGVNHLEGHFLACELSGGGAAAPIRFPCIGLIVSGGHTELWKAAGYGKYEILGRTRDDAAGEAFDKVAKLLGLGYPGGPAVEKAASRAEAYADPKQAFPRPYMDDTWDFSFSGLKTAVAYRLRDLLGADFYEERLRLPPRAEASVCLAFEEAVADTLVRKTVRACAAFGIDRVVVGGGVAANLRLRKKFSEAFRRLPAGGAVTFAERRYCTDNAAMIALCGARRLARGASRGPLDIAPDLSAASWA